MIFSEYAQYYDLLNHQKDYQKEVDYIVSLLKIFAPNAVELLDLGCGTGLHAVHLAQKGYNITGIDKSQRMINLAQNRQKQLPLSISDLLKFTKGDIRTYSINKSYDVILSLFHVISYQISNIDINQTFQNVSDHLNPGGIFIFDCWYGPAVLSDKPHKRRKQFADNNILIERNSTPTMYPTKNRVDVHFDIDIHNKLDDTSNHIEEMHKMRYLFTPEIECFLKQSSLKLVHSEEWLSGKEPSFSTWYVTFICERL